MPCSGRLWRLVIVKARQAHDCRLGSTIRSASVDRHCITQPPRQAHTGRLGQFSHLGGEGAANAAPRAPVCGFRPRPAAVPRLPALSGAVGAFGRLLVGLDFLANILPNGL